MTGLRWGILATGGIAHAFATDLRTAERDIVAVGSRREEASRSFAAEFGIPHAHASYEALVADPDVDILYIATPTPSTPRTRSSRSSTANTCSSRSPSP